MIDTYDLYVGQTFRRSCENDDGHYYCATIVDIREEDPATSAATISHNGIKDLSGIVIYFNVFQESPYQLLTSGTGMFKYAFIAWTEQYGYEPYGTPPLQAWLDLL